MSEGKIVNNLWVERYRPQKIKDCVLPESIKSVMQQYVDEAEIPHLLLAGTQGTGKTTIAKALCNEIGCDYILINASLENGIDIIRTKIAQYASSVSMSGSDLKKVIILDEADYLTPNAQSSLRGFMEQFSSNCRFILTCNMKNRIIKPLHSRCAVVDFNYSNKETPKLQAAMFRRICIILKDNDVEFEQKVVAELVKTFFPDFRRTLGELQRYSKQGSINAGILTSLSSVNIDSAIILIKGKNFKELRKWVEDNESCDPAVIFEQLYDSLYHVLSPQSVPQSVLILAEYQAKSAVVSNQSINTMAMLTELMSECSFK